jgi:hypothetical protein
MLLFVCAAKINEDAGEDADDNIAFDDVSDEDEVDDAIDAVRLVYMLSPIFDIAMSCQKCVVILCVVIL